jgi:hypothetical protein
MPKLAKAMTYDLTLELGRLLVYIGKVAQAIRYNSAYHDERIFDPHFPALDPNRDLRHGAEQRRSPLEIARDVMWLSDSLVRLTRLGTVIEEGKPERIFDTCNGLIDEYVPFTEGPDHPGLLKSNPRETMERCKSLFEPSQAVALLEAIRDKARAAMSIALAA